MEKTKILDAVQINQKLNRMAYQVYENNFKEKEIGLKEQDQVRKVEEGLTNVKMKLAELKLKQNEQRIKEKAIDTQLQTSLINKN